MKKLLAILALTLSAGMAVGQVTLAHWNFNSGASTTANAAWASPIASNSGTGSLTFNFTQTEDFSGTTDNAYQGDASGSSFCPIGSGNNGNEFILAVSTVGYSDISVTYSARTSGTTTGFNAHNIYYSTDGSSFTLLESKSGLTTSFATFTVDLSSVTATDNNANFQLKIIVDGASSTTSNNRFDNIQVRGISPISDGDGTASLVNNNVGVLNGKDIFEAATAGTSVSVTITGTSAGTLEQVTVDVPASWGTVTAPNVSLSGTGFSGANATVTGNEISVAGATLTNLQTGTITVTGLTTPDPSLVTDNGNYEFTVSTGTSEGVPVEIALSPKAYVIIPIANLKDETEGVPQDLNAYVAVKGTVSIESGLLATTNTEVYIQDGDFGVNIFKTGLTTMNLNDVYVVKGQVIQFNGLTEVSPSTASDIIFHSNGVAVEPFLSNVPELTTTIGADFESRLVAVQNVSLTSGTWPASGDAALTFSDGTNTFTVYIDGTSAIDGTVEPTWPKDLVGVWTQKSTGYGLMLRTVDDIADANTLPVELASFTASAFGSGAKLVWATKTEQNNAGFEVERKTTGNWTSLGFVAGKGTTNNPQSYSFVDAVVSGKASYRLKQVDTDGAFSYSPVVEFTGTPATFEVLGNYPNPFNPATVIKFNLPADMQVNVSVFNVLGQRVAELVNGKVTAGEKSVSFNAAGLSSGVYIYRIQAGNQTVTRSMLLTK